MEENRKWKSKWIFATSSVKQQSIHSAEKTDENEVVYFRRTFHVPASGTYRLIVDISADSRYRLYFNGEPIGVGPCPGDAQTHYYETIDLSDRVISGTNLLAVKVVHYPYSIYSVQNKGKMGPASIWRSDRGAFLLEGQLVEMESGAILETLHTDEKWKTLRDTALSFNKESFTLCVGGTEQVDGHKVPHGWEEAEYNDRAWPQAIVISGTHDPGWGSISPWFLTARSIPLPFEQPQSFRCVIRADGIPDLDPLPENSMHIVKNLEIPPGKQVWIELDAGEMTTGYLQLEVSGGKNSQIKMTCSECYEVPNPLDDNHRIKGVRDDPTDKTLLGPTDEYRVSGQADEKYEPFTVRAFRFVRLDIQVADAPLILRNISYRETGYPLEIQSRFTSSDPSLTDLWNVSLNTLKRCMHESYMDTPYYERLQYAMDSRLQALFTYPISGDDRLARKTLFDFHSSLMPTGMLQSRYPSMLPQVIPGFALYWIMMVHDHYQYFLQTLI